jgi:putative ABC transport system permease protein
MISYAIKRVFRSLGLFAALLLGVVLASTFFAGINIGADTTAKAALNQQLRQVPVDIVVRQYGSSSSNLVAWESAASRVATVNGVVDTEVICRAYWNGNFTFKYGASFMVVALSGDSHVYDGLTVVSGASGLGANEAYVWADSNDADKIGINGTLSMNFTYYYGTYPQTMGTLTLSLKVVGVVQLDETAYSIATQDSYGTIMLPTQDKSQLIYHENLLIVSWEETLAELVDAIPSSVPSYSNPFNMRVLVYLDREGMINPWDIPSSLESVRKATDQTTQEVAQYGMSANNNLESILMQFQFVSLAMRLSFLVVALPVFFIAWYVGTTVSDVSYNLRRREIGLLLTKGFSNGQLFRMFLTESVLIGTFGGLIGVGLGLLLSPFFATTVGGDLGTAPVLNQEVIIIAVIFGLAITLLSTFRPSRRASKLPTIDALREYMYVEEVKPYKQRLPWLAFVLGTYKIVIFLLGINLIQLLMGRPPPFGNIFLLVLLGVWIIIDSVLTYIGPLLFFWGFTKIFIHGSLKFQELVTRAVKFLGDLGTLATKNVRRNPARAASVAFLIALIVGYAFQTVGSLASEQDYTIRQVKAGVGADIKVQINSTANGFTIADTIENLTGVASATPEYLVGLSLPGQYSTQSARAVDPRKWLSTAYYENEWFSGNDVAKAFQQMRTNNKTIILERNVAKNLQKRVGDVITLTVERSTVQLTIVGFFGYEIVQQQSYTPDSSWGVFWSYVPIGLFDSLDTSPSSSVSVSVKLEAGVDGKSVASEILKLAGVTYVSSVAEDLENYQSNLMYMGSLNIQRIGVIFSILAASVATGLVTVVSLQERKKEASIMNARGMSFKQLITMFLTENLAIVVFAVILGVIVGLIIVRGAVSASNAILTYSLITHRIVFPPDAILLLSTCIVLIFLSAITPVLLLTKRYISKIERIVRL